mgnify:CR=1 FL=1
MYFYISIASENRFIVGYVFKCEDESKLDEIVEQKIQFLESKIEIYDDEHVTTIGQKLYPEDMESKISDNYFNRMLTLDEVIEMFGPKNVSIGVDTTGLSPGDIVPDENLKGTPVINSIN